MILDNDIDIGVRIDKQAQLLKDLEEAVMFALSEISPSYRIGATHLHLQFHIRGRKGWRVTPEVIIDCGNQIVWDIKQYKIDDINTIYKLVEDRLTREKLTWDDIEIDIRKEHIYDSNYLAK